MCVKMQLELSSYQLNIIQAAVYFTDIDKTESWYDRIYIYIYIYGYDPPI